MFHITNFSDLVSIRGWLFPYESVNNLFYLRQKKQWLYRHFLKLCISGLRLSCGCNYNQTIYFFFEDLPQHPTHQAEWRKNEAIFTDPRMQKHICCYTLWRITSIYSKLFYFLSLKTKSKNKKSVNISYSIMVLTKIKLLIFLVLSRYNQLVYMKYFDIQTSKYNLIQNFCSDAWHNNY